MPLLAVHTPARVVDTQSELSGVAVPVRGIWMDGLYSASAVAGAWS